MAGIVGGTDRHYRGRGIGVHAGTGHDQIVPDGQGGMVKVFVPAPITGEASSPGSPTQWRCPSCGVENISVREDGCPSCGAGTKAEAERAAMLAKDTKHTPEEVAPIVFGVQGVTAAELLGWIGCLRQPAQNTLVRALAHYAEHGAPMDDGSELTRQQIISWARAMLSPEE